MSKIKRSLITKAYQNPYGQSFAKRLLKLLSYTLTSKERALKYGQVPSNFTYPKKEKSFSPQAPKVTWINHSSFLIEVEGITFLTDPIFSERCSPVSFAGPIRKHPPGLSIQELENVDFILISHDHYDHLDKKSVLALQKRFPHIQWMVPKGLAKWFQKRKIQQVVEFEWWQEHLFLDKKIKITATPAQHFSGRKPFWNNRTLWLGYVVEFLDLDKKVYFAGDTGYNNVHFNQVGEYFGSLDLSLIPIGAYLPKCFMQTIHVSPCEAVQVHLDVRSKLSIASHFKTFNLALEDLKQPPFDLYCALQEQQLDPQSFVVLEPGETLNW